jgi:hypothetical protein
MTDGIKVIEKGKGNIPFTWDKDSIEDYIDRGMLTRCPNQLRNEKLEQLGL